MASDSELYILVENAVKSLREGGQKVTARSVLEIVKHKAEDVLRAYHQFREFEQKKIILELQQAISQNIAKELIRDREAYADSKTQLFRDEIDQLAVDFEVMGNVIAGLRIELKENNERSSSARQALDDTINNLSEENSRIKGDILSHLGEIKVLTMDRDKARQERNEAETKRSGLQSTLAVKSDSERRERARANKLQIKLNEATTRIETLEKMVAELEQKSATTKTNR